MSSQLKILIDALWRGKGATSQARGDLASMGAASTQASVQMAAMAARSEQLQSKMRELGRAVADGKMSVAQASTAFQNFKGSLSSIDNVAGETNFSLGSLIGTYGKVAAAATAAGVAIKKGFEFAEAGAGLLQLEASFDGLNASMLRTPGLLNELKEASRGTISEAQLMQGVLKLVAGASEETSRAMSEASPRLLEIAKAAQKLNPTLGDTAFLYDSITTGIKRSSPMILDNLGIIVKVGEANEAYAAALGKTVEQLTAEEKQIALLNATLEAGDNLIAQAGGNIDSLTDRYTQLRVGIEEATDALKIGFAEGLMGLDFDETNEGLEEMVEGMRETGKFAGELLVTLEAISQWSPPAIFGKLLEGLFDIEGRDFISVPRIEASIALEEARKLGEATEYADQVLRNYQGSAYAAGAANRELAAAARLVEERQQAVTAATQGASDELAEATSAAHREIDRTAAAVGDLRASVEERDFELRWRGIREAREELVEVKRLLGEDFEVVAKISAEGEPALFEVVKTIAIDGFAGRRVEIPVDIIVNERGEQVGEMSLFQRLLEGRKEAIEQKVEVTLAFETRQQTGEQEQLYEQAIRKQVQDLTSGLLGGPEGPKPLEIPITPAVKLEQALIDMEKGLIDVQKFIDGLEPLRVKPDVDDSELDEMVRFLEGDTTVALEGVFGEIHKLETEDNLPVLDSRLQNTLDLVNAIAGTHYVNFVTTSSGGGNPHTGPYDMGGPSLNTPAPPQLDFQGVSGGGQTVNIQPGAIVVSGVSDPNRAAEAVIEKLEDRGVVARMRLR